MWTYQTTNIVHNFFKCYKKIFHWTLQLSLLHAETREWAALTPEFWTYTHFHITENQFIMALVSERQELKKLLKWKLELFKYEVFLTMIFLCDELFLSKIFQSELYYRCFENADCTNSKVVLYVCRTCITTIVFIWKIVWSHLVVVVNKSLWVL